ncbi:RNA 2',3'-cyclic phosphodiesterase [Streptomyces gobiensis]|uniref:RNA 2',3'-cyclic phosphodiesterase n=1 Tax=Streptomyces gobiensis TaxID=2875706 RepID=UPI001E432A21|nr:RNA 2',3'-cyclic phosphodiesterase [Streptomyces gobiensis]UGY92066.1 RNA 2',3'-cyclic phosphodiesterase [Streptomyces gobiensis]
MRLFAAVIPPESVAHQLGAAVAPLHTLPGADRLRWTEPAGWHFTIAFYGEVAEEKLPELSVRLERAAKRHHPFEVCFSGGGRFGDRALWIGVAGAEAREAMARLAATAQAAGRRAGVTHEDPHAYTAHLTIARSRERGRPRAPGGRVALLPYTEALADFASVTWEVGELVLLHSRPPVSGVPGERPRYERVAGWPLGG